MTPTDKIILDLCGGTGAWSKPYKDAGYDVRLVTLPEYDVRTYEPPEGVYGILAAPPCEQFSIASGKKWQDRNLRSGIELVKACMEIIWNAQCQKQLRFWCLENPVGLLRQFLGKSPFSMEYWEFGDSLGKRTDLWGYFNFPQKLYTEPPGLLNKIKNVSNWGSKAKEVRAITPPCYAKAFFKANQ